MRQLIEDFDRRYLLGIPEMDETHREFVALVNKLGVVGKSEFIALFATLRQHTEAHFSAEERLMEATAFPATREHKDDHLRILGELERFGRRVAAGSVQMGRAYIIEQLPKWFEVHAATMDSALAAHLGRKAG